MWIHTYPSGEGLRGTLKSRRMSRGCCTRELSWTWRWRFGKTSLQSGDLETERKALLVPQQPEVDQCCSQTAETRCLHRVPVPWWYCRTYKAMSMQWKTRHGATRKDQVNSRYRCLAVELELPEASYENPNTSVLYLEVH